MFSIILKNVSEETYSEKIKGWGKITDSVLRDQETSFDKKRYFISSYIGLDIASIKYLLKIKIKDGLTPQEVYGSEGYPPKSNTEYELNYIG